MEAEILTYLCDPKSWGFQKIHAHRNTHDKIVS